ncbi:serine hydrolase [Roseixanthobacter pseudopolyaromaticivorans]|uniref:serine hydrolase n=1 Tax=Xanthobacteraceae TaxID=335928 RepID=UPI00372635AD
MSLNRRLFLSGAAVAPMTLAHPAFAGTVPEGVVAGLKLLDKIPATKSALIVCEGPGQSWQDGRDPDAALFVGSAVKTFILAQALRAAEAGLLSETDQWAVDDAVRSASSPVLLNLSGTTQARSVLEAMIAHSDNTATDITLAKVGPDKVRALIAEAGLPKTRIPDSTRRLFSYIAGAPQGTDIGWEGVKKLETGWMPGPPRPAVNEHETMVSTATELVKWYQTALTGTFFSKPESLTEFARILSMADAIAQVVPPGIAAYAKGGSIDWANFHCFCLPGQMVVGAARVTFCFTVNWTGPDDSVATVFPAFRDAVAATLKGAVDALRA